MWLLRQDAVWAPLPADLEQRVLREVRAGIPAVKPRTERRADLVVRAPARRAAARAAAWSTVKPDGKPVIKKNPATAR